MQNPGSVTRLIAQIASGGSGEREAAAAAIWKRYRERLFALARHHLRPRVRRREDEDDVLQNMYKSFCLRARQGEFQLDSRAALWDLLAAMTVNKARHVLTFHTRKKRHVEREHAGAGGPLGDSEIDESLIEQLRSLEPGPEDAVELAEGLERRLDALGDPGLAQLALWKLEGYTNQEIAVKLECVERTVERKLVLIRRKWEETSAE